MCSYEEDLRTWGPLRRCRRRCRECYGHWSMSTAWWSEDYVADPPGRTRAATWSLPPCSTYKQMSLSINYVPQRSIEAKKASTMYLMSPLRSETLCMLIMSLVDSWWSMILRSRYLGNDPGTVDTIQFRSKYYDSHHHWKWVYLYLLPPGGILGIHMLWRTIIYVWNTFLNVEW